MRRSMNDGRTRGPRSPRVGQAWDADARHGYKFFRTMFGEIKGLLAMKTALAQSAGTDYVLRYPVLLAPYCLGGRHRSTISERFSVMCLLFESTASLRGGIRSDSLDSAGWGSRRRRDDDAYALAPRQHPSPTPLAPPFQPRFNSVEMLVKRC